MWPVQAETAETRTTPCIPQHLIHGTVTLAAVTSVVLVVLGMALIPTMSRLVELRSESMLLVRGDLGLPEVRTHTEVCCRSRYTGGCGQAWGISTGSTQLTCGTMLFITQPG